MIDANFITKILELAPTTILDLNGKTYTDKKTYPVRDAEVESIDIHTLSGLVSFTLTLPEEDLATAIFHVKDYNTVALVSDVFGENKQRETYATAKAYDLQHRFNTRMDVESFIIYLQSMFVQDETTAKIMQIVGNLTQGSEMNVADDGFTQRVTAKAGVTRVQVVDLPNPVTLRPYRTFADIEQPASKFILRIKADKDEGPKCGLYEADGGAWKNQAIATIATYFAGRLPGVHLVA